MSQKETHRANNQNNRQPNRNANVPNSTENDVDEYSTTLSQQYRTELSQLKQIFSEWSEGDLLTSLEEANGDLELTISRISEGHSQQWGQVTKNKRKTDKPKSKSEAVIPASNAPAVQSVDSRAPRREYSGRGRGGGVAGRGGRGGGRGGRGRGSYSSRPPRHQQADEIALDEQKDSVEPAVEPADDWGAEPEAKEVEVSLETTDISTQPAQSPPRKTEVINLVPVSKPVQVTSKNPLNSKTSWAQLVKGPEPVVVQKPAPIPEKPRAQQVRPPSPVKEQSPERSTSPQRSVSPSRSVGVNQSSPTRSITQNTYVPEVVSEPVLPTNVKQIPSRSPSPVKEPSKPSPQLQQVTIEEKVSEAPPGLKQQIRQPVQRTLKQNAAVVMPSNTPLSSIGVQFGSLKIGGVQEEEDSTPEQTQNTAPPASIGTVSHTITSTSPSLNAQTLGGSVPTVSTAMPSASVPLPASSGPRVPNISSGMPINPFVQFGLSQMGNLPAEYSGLYNTEAQVRAASMGYYDPTGYGQMASNVSKFPGQESTQQPTTSGQSSPGSAQQPQHQPHQPLTMPLQQQAQQQFHNPYYYPYYMNQFQNPYQSSVYGQPFVNKSLYPGYPTAQSQVSAGQPGSAPKSGGVPILPGGGYYSSANQPHLYQQSMGYDDISSGPVGLSGPQDYAKNSAGMAPSNMYGVPQQQFPGFGLGSAQQSSGVNSAKVPANGNSNAQASNVDFKNQPNNRPPRQGYEPHKFPGSQTNGPQANGAQSVNTNPGMSVNGANSNSTGGGGNQMYYSQQQQQHFGGLQGSQLGYQPHLMHQQYQSQTSGGIYGQNAAAAAQQAASRQGQPYWANQN